MYLHYLFVPNQRFNAVLLLPGEDGLTLPVVPMEDAPPWHHVEAINQAAGEMFGFNVTTLCCLGQREETDTAVFALENHSGDDPLPPDGTWYGQDGLSRIEPAQRPLLDYWLEWAAARNPLRPAWYRPGWMAGAQQWMADQLSRLGYTPWEAQQRFTQLRCSGRSMVARVKTPQGDLYFKASGPHAHHEARLTNWLASSFPKRIPRVAAVDEEAGWMFTNDFEADLLSRSTDPTLFVAALAQFGALQARLAGDLDRLQALGCPDARLPQIVTAIDPFLEELPTRYSHLLGLEEIERLRASGPVLRKLCFNLEDCHIPYTLEHGDFRPSQVAVRQSTGGLGAGSKGFIFHDWALACLSHPFFSLWNFVDALRGAYPQMDAAAEETLIAPYLMAWSSLASETQIRRALRFSRPLAALHGALIYDARILPWLEVKWEQEAMIPVYLRRLLTHLQNSST